MCSRMSSINLKKIAKFTVVIAVENRFSYCSVELLHSYFKISNISWITLTTTALLWDWIEPIYVASHHKKKLTFWIRLTQVFWLIGVRNSNCGAFWMPAALSQYMYIVCLSTLPSLRRNSYFVIFKRKFIDPYTEKMVVLPACMFCLWAVRCVCMYWTTFVVFFFLFRCRFVSL